DVMAIITAPAAPNSLFIDDLPTALFGDPCHLMTLPDLKHRCGARGGPAKGKSSHTSNPLERGFSVTVPRPRLRYRLHCQPLLRMSWSADHEISRGELSHNDCNRKCHPGLRGRPSASDQGSAHCCVCDQLDRLLRRREHRWRMGGGN